MSAGVGRSFPHAPAAKHFLVILLTAGAATTGGDLHDSQKQISGTTQGSDCYEMRRNEALAFSLPIQMKQNSRSDVMR